MFNLVPVTASTVTAIQQISAFSTLSASDIAWSPDGVTLAIASPDGVWLSHAFESTPRLILPGDYFPGAGYGWPYDMPLEIAFCPSGALLAFCTMYLRICLIEVETKKLIKVGITQGLGINDLMFSPDGTLLASATDIEVAIWDITSGIRKVLPEGCGTVVFSPHRSEVAYNDGEGVRLWDLIENKEPQRIAADVVSLECLRYSPDGTILASGHASGEVKLWDVSTGKEQATLYRQGDWIEKMEFSPDGSLLATVGRNVVRFWDVAARKELKSLERQMKGIAFNRSGTLLAFANPTVTCWGVNNAT